MKKTYEFKIVIGIKKSFTEKIAEAPRYFDTLKELKEYYNNRKTILKENESIWFARVWEFGKEDYKDMNIELE